MKFRIEHITHYEYDEPITICHNLAHLNPRSTERQTCSSSAIVVTPAPISTSTREDYFGNTLCYFSIQQPHRELTITATSEVDLIDSGPNLDLELGVSCAKARELLHLAADDETLAAREFMLSSPLIRLSAELADFAQDLFVPTRPLLSAVRALNQRIFETFTYDPESTTVTTGLSEVMEHKRGVCQDFAQLAIGCLRSLGYPARYVSGYIETLPAPGEEKLRGADASHAWFAIYSPGEGWYEFDPTNNSMAGDQHITAAWGRDYSDVTPLKGVIFGGGEGQRLKISVDVERLP